VQSDVFDVFFLSKLDVVYVDRWTRVFARGESDLRRLGSIGFHSPHSEPRDFDFVLGPDTKKGYWPMDVSRTVTFSLSRCDLISVVGSQSTQLVVVAEMYHPKRTRADGHASSGRYIVGSR
jgi:hypothetical protein